MRGKLRVRIYIKILLVMLLLFSLNVYAQSGWWASVSSDYSWGDWHYTGYEEVVYTIKPVFSYTLGMGVDLSDNIAVETSFYYSNPIYDSTLELYGYKERIYGVGFSFTYYWPN